MDTIMMSDLKTGMIIELNNQGVKQSCMVLRNTDNGDILAGDTWMPLESLDMEKVLKVSVPRNNADYAFFTRYSNKETKRNSLETLWIKPEPIQFKEMTVEDVERLVGSRVKIIGDN